MLKMPNTASFKPTGDVSIFLLPALLFTMQHAFSLMLFHDLNLMFDAPAAHL